MKSLKRILFTRYLVALLLIVVGVGLIMLLPLRSQILKAKKDHIKLQARSFAALAAPYYLEGNIQELRRLAGSVSSTGASLTVIDSDGKELLQYGTVPPGTRYFEGQYEVREALEGAESVTMRKAPNSGESYIYSAVPIRVEDNVEGVVRLAVRTGSVMPEVSLNWVATLGGLLILLLVLFGVTFWVEKTLSTDLKQLGAGMEEIVVAGTLDEMPRPRLTELGELARDLETIADQVRENYQMLSSERDKLETILVNISTGILVLDSDGRIELINPVAERILGVDREGALGRMLTEMHPSSVLDRAVEEAKSGREVTEEVTITLPRETVLRLVASPVTRGENVSAIICLLEDITSTRRLERVRRDFVANVSHELRTPVASLRAIIEAMDDGAVEDEELAARFLRNLDKESSRMMGIIEDLLVLSRLEAEGFRLTAAPVDVRSLIEEVMEEKSSLAARHGVSLELKPGPDIAIQGDVRLLKTACGNLLDNAVKYNREGGRVDVSLEGLDGGVVIVVSDTGLGIPAKDREKVFERFFRVDRARSRETGGTGLGLSIVRHVVELHGGRVELESSEGRGSTFRLVIQGPAAGGNTSRSS